MTIPPAVPIPVTSHFLSAFDPAPDAITATWTHNAATTLTPTGGVSTIFDVLPEKQDPSPPPMRWGLPLSLDVLGLKYDGAMYLTSWRACGAT
ncbi:hypothetical protein NQ176_g10267 [Zarea fungicola]|uniref:Uncharacterized protein n=1 Tax=Zarea fungicola TaxID=93591 RepID=A0ACC1MGP9_9HYPO|nr:hypothetical protein NQ176_g10267 [Lecanicillium fungicola]